LAILGGSFSGEARGRAIGIWSAASAITSAVGPVLGGWLIDAFGWREIFLHNIPLAAGAIGLALAFVRDAPDDTGVKAPFDLLGALLAAASLALLTWGLTIGAGRSGWTSSALGAVVIGGALLAAFLGVEKRRGNAAMMPLALFGSTNFVALSLLTILLYGALGGLLLLVPYVLIQGSGFSATAAGAALLPFPLAVAVLSPAMGAVAGRIGSRIPLMLGPLIVAAGFLLFLPFGAGSNYWSGLLPAIMVVSFGMSGAVAPLTSAVLASVDPHHAGSASGLNSALARLGGLIATALLGGVFSQKGEALFAAFHVAVIACAVAAAAAGIAVFALLKSRRIEPGARS
jgi:MFS family permease